MTLDRTKYKGAVTVGQDGIADWSGDVQVLAKHAESLAPLSWSRPRWIFINIMSDTFHKDIPTTDIARQLALADLTPQHIWMLCTKRERRMHDLLNDDQFRVLVQQMAQDIADSPKGRGAIASGSAQAPTGLWPIPNLWCGVTLEHSKYSYRVMKWLADTPAAIRFASSEPLMDGLDNLDTGKLDWILVGGEDLEPARDGIRPMHPAWARDLRQRCEASGTAFWFKQWGSGYPVGQGGREADHKDFRDMTARPARYDEDKLAAGPDLWLGSEGRLHEAPQPGDQLVRRMHKKRAGHHLDGETILQVPKGWEAHPAIVAHLQKLAGKDKLIPVTVV